jgi:hypothetical protein
MTSLRSVKPVRLYRHYHVVELTIGSEQLRLIIVSLNDVVYLTS